MGLTTSRDVVFILFISEVIACLACDPSTSLVCWLRRSSPSPTPRPVVVCAVSASVRAFLAEQAAQLVKLAGGLSEKITFSVTWDLGPGTSVSNYTSFQ